MSDKLLTCIDCGMSFKFSIREQELFNKFRFDPPKRCFQCRKNKKLSNVKYTMRQSIIF